MAISTEKLLQSSSIRCEQTCYFEFGSTQACLKLNEVCATAVYLFEGYLSIWSELHIIVHEQVRQWAWCFYLEKSWSIRYLACKSQERGKIYEHHILEYVVVGGIPIPDKLQETARLMTVSVQWKFLSQEQFKYTISLRQPWNSSTKVPCFTCFASRSGQKSRLHFPAYQNGNSPQMPGLNSVYTMGIEYLYSPFHTLSGISQQVSKPDGRSGVAICNAIGHITLNDSPTRELPVLNSTKVKDKTLVESIDNSEEKKQAQNASAMGMAAVLHANNVEEDKLAEDTSSEEVRVVQSTGKNHAKERTEDGSAKRMDGAFSTDDIYTKHTDDTSKPEEADEVQ